MTPLLKLALNNAWANATLHNVVAGLSPEAFAAPRPGFFPSLAATLGHILEVDHYYLDALEGGGEGLALFACPPPTAARALSEAQALADRRLIELCKGLTAEALANPVTIERRDGMMEEGRENVLLHLFQHQIHHRGQAHAQVSHAGLTPPQLDEFFLHYDRAPSARAYWR